MTMDEDRMFLTDSLLLPTEQLFVTSFTSSSPSESTRHTEHKQAWGLWVRFSDWCKALV